MYLVGSECKIGTQWIPGNSSRSWMKCSTTMRKVAVACPLISLLQARFLSHTSSLLPGEEREAEAQEIYPKVWFCVCPLADRDGKGGLSHLRCTCLLPRSGHVCHCILTLSWKNQCTDHPRGNNPRTEPAPLLDSSILWLWPSASQVF